MLFMPASHAEAIRRPATQRPRNTAFGPCFSKKGWPTASASSRWRWNGPGITNSRRPPLRPIAKPTLSPMIAAADGDHDQRHDVHLPVVREQRCGDQRGLARHRDPHRLDRDQREDDASSRRSAGCRRSRRTRGPIVAGMERSALESMSEAVLAIAAEREVDPVLRRLVARRARAGRRPLRRARDPGRPGRVRAVHHRGDERRADRRDGAAAAHARPARRDARVARAPTARPTSARTRASAAGGRARTRRCARSSASRSSRAAR